MDSPVTADQVRQTERLLDERLAEYLALVPKNADGTPRSKAWIARIPAPDIFAILTELQHRREAEAVDFVAEEGGLEVATFQPDAFSLLEISKPRSGGFAFVFTVHSCNEETGRWTDLSIALLRKDASRISELLAASPSSPASGVRVSEDVQRGIDWLRGKVGAAPPEALIRSADAIEGIARADSVALAEALDERDALSEAARDLISSRTDTFRAGNNRQVGIQDDSGEKCWIVRFDEMAALEKALSALGKHP